MKGCAVRLIADRTTKASTTAAVLCYTREQVNKDPYPLDWNALYESFAVHARSLMDFLSNANDPRNFNACTFSGTFSFKDDSELHRVVVKIAKAKSISRLLLARRTWTCSLMARAAGSTSSIVVTLLELTSTAITLARPEVGLVTQ
jgi:hypothetical protein